MFAQILWPLLFMCLNFLSVTSSKEISKFDSSSVDIIHGELELRRHLESWIENVEKQGLDSVCYDNDDKDIIDNNDINVKVTETCQIASFSGEVINGLPHGKGTLKFKNNKKKEDKNNICLKKQFVFFEGKSVVQIKGRFDNGVPDGKVNVKFSDGLKAKFFVKHGLAHGFFKAELGDYWTVGSFANGTVSGECWIVDKETVLYQKYMFCLNMKPIKTNKFWNMAWSA